MPDLIPKFQQIDEVLKNARRVLVAAHEKPDPDAVSAVLLLHHVFKKHLIAKPLQGAKQLVCNLESLAYLPDFPSKNLSYLPGFFEIQTSHSVPCNSSGIKQTKLACFEPDILFALDYGDFKRLRLPEHILNKFRLEPGSASRLEPGSKRIVITIDHHVESDQRGDIKILEPDFSSTAEILYHWLQYKNIEIDREMAACLLTGIISDSGGFRHVSTSSETLNIVSQLLSKGVSLNKIIRQTLTLDRPLHLAKVWGKILSRTQLDKRTNLAYSWLDWEDLNNYGVSLVEFDGIANLISSGSSANLGLFLVEYEKGKIKGSLRSEPYQGRDVVKIAKALGGGGHVYAAGFSQEGTIEETLKKVLNLIE